MTTTSYLILFTLLAATPGICGEQQAASGRKPLSEENWARKLLDGDMVFIRSISDNANDIAALSGPSPGADPDKVFTHCGIVFKEDNVWKVYEGRGRREQTPVSLKQWQLDEGKGEARHQVYVRRLADRSVLTEGKDGTLEKIRAKAKALHHTRYDFGFMWTTDDFVYCSELIWKAYNAAGLAENVLKRPHAIADYLQALPKETANGIMIKLNNTDAKRCRPEGKKDFLASEQAITPEEIYDSAGLASVNDGPRPEQQLNGQ